LVSVNFLLWFFFQAVVLLLLAVLMVAEWQWFQGVWQLLGRVVSSVSFPFPSLSFKNFPPLLSFLSLRSLFSRSNFSPSVNFPRVPLLSFLPLFFQNNPLSSKNSPLLLVLRVVFIG
jgi:hypothetical protein